MRRRFFSPNYHLADCIAQLNLGLKRRKRFIYVSYTNDIKQLIFLLYKQGVLRTFRVEGDLIRVYFKYFRGRSVCTRISIVSKFSKRVYWTVNKLTLMCNKNNFGGFYILSTSFGYCTSTYCILTGFLGGEVICKVEF